MYKKWLKKEKPTSYFLYLLFSHLLGIKILKNAHKKEKEIDLLVIIFFFFITFN